MTEPGLIAIGKITRHQGNRGEVRVLPLTDFPERFELLDRVFLVRGEEKLEREIENVRSHKGFIILKFKGIDSLDEAFKLRDYLLNIPEEELLPLAEDEYYVDQLNGFKVYTAEGQYLGEIAEVIFTGGTDVLLIKGGQKEYLIPTAREFITEIDEEEGRIVIQPIPGLLDL